MMRIRLARVHGTSKCERKQDGEGRALGDGSMEKVMDPCFGVHLASRERKESDRVPFLENFHF